MLHIMLREFERSVEDVDIGEKLSDRWLTWVDGGQRVGTVIGRYGIPYVTDNCERIHRVCASSGTSVANVYFELRCSSVHVKQTYGRQGREEHGVSGKKKMSVHDLESRRILDGGGGVLKNRWCV